MIESDNNNKNENLIEDEIDIKKYFDIAWNGRKIILSFTIISSLISIIYSLTLSNYYISESLLTIRDAQDSRPLSEYSGLASMAGINLPSSGSSSVFHTIEMIQSREFVRHLITFENVLPSIMAPHSYDKKLTKLIFDIDIYDEDTQKWTRKPSQETGIKPSYLEAHKKLLKDMLSISHDEKTGLIFISVEHISPVFAKDFLSLVIKETNKINRKKDMDSSGKALNLLKKELSSTSILEIKQSINKLIESQLETQMMTSMHDEYLLITLDPPFVPETKSKPNRGIIVVLTTILAAMLSTVFLVLWNLYKEIK